MKRCLITFLDRDGLVAAALLLRQMKDAEVRISSAARIGNTLGRLADGTFDEIHICGLGMYCTLEEVLGPLRRLKRKKTRVVWYCSGDYLDQFAPSLKRYASLVFDHSDRFISEVMFDQLKKPDEHSERLLQLFEDDGEGDRMTDLLERLADASILAYFKFRDHDAVPNVVRKLAFPETLIAQDRAFARRFEYVEDCYLVGRTPAMTSLMKTIEKVGADRDSRVLILGETGAGKEVIARLLHESSPRRAQPFLAVNCANFSEQLLDSQLFGHEKGAFTGAVEQHQGDFELADGGTLFLDEIGDMQLGLQAKLLRVLQMGCFRRIGGSEELSVDVRVVSATNHDLFEEVEKGTFRADLYYRINTIVLRAPPLRDIPDDIPRIAQDIIYRYCHARGINSWRLTHKQAGDLRDHSWPGNVRELQNVIERAIVLDDRDFSKHIGSRGAAPSATQPAGGNMDPADIRPLRDVEHDYVLQVYSTTGQNKTQAAKLLGISVNTLKKKLGTQHTS